ncbi:MAG: tetratricopeptide repeat protein [Elusimicrobiaceae bacterium]|nr:tetratricopeptide repeat protein [Elusimicrobiaceae bacterium]
MPGFKLFLLKAAGLSLVATVLSLPAAADVSEPVKACLQEGKQQFSNQQYQVAKETFTRCVKLAPSDAETQLSLAGVLLTLEDLDGAEQAFRAALSVMTRTSPYLSYTYSMLGDIALKRQQNDEAFVWYTKSLESNAANVNSLVGKGVIVEYQGDKKGAAEFYRSALAVEPLNLIARQRLVNLEPDYFSDEEILDALKQRYAISPKTTELTDEMRQTFVNIHRAEQRRGVNYLKKKYPKVPADFLVTINKGTDFERELLTKDGYDALQKHIGQDAIGVFQKAGVPVKDVFSLRDMKGNKIFKADSTLTDSGFFVYTEALQNRKAFLLPDESVAPSKETLAQIARVEEELKKAGYVEISRKELKFLEKETKCSEETLRKELGVYALPVNKKTRRYFIIAQQTPDPKKGIPYYYLMKERAKYDKSVKVPKNSLAESYAYYGYTICFDDGKLLN